MLVSFFRLGLCMTLYRLLGYALAITFVFGAMRTVPRAQTELSYDAFAKLSAPERSDYWNATTPQVRSRLAQGHLTAWMTANQRRLSADQISNLKAVIALLTPEFYG